MNAILPAPPTPRLPITIRPATSSDLPFIDSLQKLHSKQVGWMPTKQLEGKIAADQVLVAWAAGPCSSSEENTGWQPVPREERVGYVIAQDQYFKRDDLGIIYQLNVAPNRQRGFIGAALLKAQFDRSAYGCKLYCCWCAQDIEANRFWEACGFVPLAFRAGSESKQRIHIFWQKRIHEGDTTTPWWFPSQTKGGAMMEDRLVFPIPPGTHWSDAKPIILPRHTQKQLEDAGAKKVKAAPVTIIKRQPLGGGLMFAAPKPAKRPGETAKPRKQKIKNDPKYVAAARELRDRWLEKVNAEPSLLSGASGKYDLSKELPAAAPFKEILQLPVAA